MSFTIVKVLGLLYVLFSFADLRTNFNLKNNEKIIMPLMLIWIWLVFRSMYNYEEGNTVDAFHFSFIQNIAFLWLLTNDLLKSPKIVKSLLISYIAGVSLLGILILNGVGIDTDPFYESNRVTFFGANSNSIGNWCATGVIFIFGIFVTKIPVKFSIKIAMITSVPILISVILSTGSRGSLLALALGSLVLFSGFRSKFYLKILYFIVGAFALNYMIEMIENSEVMSKRFALFLESGDEARLNIWRDTINIIYDYPAFGLGNTGFENEMILRYGYFLDSHNIFLYFLVCGGVIATILYLYFLKSMFLNIFSNKIRNTLLFPLSLYLVYMLVVFKSGGIINDKSTWLLLGFVYGFYYYFSTLNAVNHLKKSTTVRENPLLHR